MRPRLKSDTFSIPVEDGLYLRNNEHSLVLKGKTLALWMERIAPLLDGNHDLEYLCRNLPTEKQAMVSRLVSILLEQGYARDCSADEPHTLSPLLQDIYSSAIAFIDYHTGSGPYRFQQFLAQPLLAIASGDALVALAHALLETGNRHIYLADSGEGSTDYDRISALLSTLQADRDADLTLHTAHIENWNDDDSMQEMLKAYTCVLLFSTGRSPVFVQRLSALCYRAGTVFIPAVTLPHEVVIGPTQHPGKPACWQCYRLRHGSARQAAVDSEDASSPPGKTAIALTANLLVLECFKQATEIQKETLDGQVFVLGLQRLESSLHPVFPHPLCPVCSQPSLPSADHLSHEIARLQQREPAPVREEFLKQTERWIDEQGGIFVRLDEQDFYQLPLVRCRVAVALPPASLETQLAAHAAGLDYLEVRELALRQAAALYLERLVDSRELLLASYAELASRQAIVCPEDIFSWQANTFTVEQPLAWCQAWQLDKGHAVLMPTAAAYPSTVWNIHEGERLFRQHTPGTGVGASWHEALARGLLDLASAIDREADSGDSPSRLLARTAYAGDSVCAAYLKMLDIMEEEVRLEERTGASGLPQIVASLGARRVGLTTHWNALAAARDALKGAVLTAQIRRFPAPGDEQLMEERQSVEEDCSAGMADITMTTNLPPSLATETDFEVATQALQTCFRRRGWALLVVPLGRDCTVAGMIGCALRIVAVRSTTTAAATNLL